MNDNQHDNPHDNPHDNQPPADKWHMGKEVPLALILMMSLQTLGAVWWAATQSAKLDYLADMIRTFQTQQYTQADAKRDMELTLQRSNANSSRLSSLEAWRSGMESRRGR
jgi:hypothetical protein